MRLFLSWLACLTLAVGQTPPNDLCANPIQLFDGTNPQPAASGHFFDNFGATTDGGAFCGIWFPVSPQNDVYFSYTATCSIVTIDTCTPPGFAPGTLTNDMIVVYQACPPINLVACNSDDCSGRSRVTFSTNIGQSYVLHVSHEYPGPTNGTFYVTVHQGGVAPIGSPCGGGLSYPVFWMTPNLFLGMGQVTSCTLTISFAAPNSPAAIFLSPFGAPPTDLSSVQAGCTAYVDLNALTLAASFTTNAGGAKTLMFPVPNDPALQCMAFVVQGVVLPVSGSPLIQITQGLKMVLGY